jgi:hypothetical protein
MMPSVVIAPSGDFTVQSEFLVDGETKEPSVSVPIATGANPAATAIPLPEDDPSGLCANNLDSAQYLKK